MKVIKKGNMPDGTKIQIEEWNEDYDFKPYASTIACFTESKKSHKGQFTPKEDEVYRFGFNFESEEITKKAFDELVTGKKSLQDFKENLHIPEFTDCL